MRSLLERLRMADSKFIGNKPSHFDPDWRIM